MSGDLSAFPRLPIAIGEKQLWHFAECKPASCPLVGRVVSCLRAQVLLTGRAEDLRVMNVDEKQNVNENPITERRG